MYSILIADEMHESLFPLLEAKGFSYEYCPDIKRAELIEKLPGVEGLLIRSKTRVDEELLQKADKLKFVGRAGAGLDTIDTQYLEKAEIVLHHAAEGNCDALAEHALGLLLALTNNIVKSHTEIKEGRWLREGNRGYEVLGKTAAVIGYGNMGKATAKRLKAIGCKVLAYDKYLKGFSDDVVSEASLDEVFEKADIVSLHVPLTEETIGGYDDGFFQQFKNSIFFINTARGKVVIHKSLIKALNDGKVLGAGLDVFENEKLHALNPNEQELFQDLLSRPNVIFTPHVGGWSFESYKKINEVLVDKIANN